MLNWMRDWRKRVAVSVLVGVLFCVGWVGEKKMIEEQGIEERGIEGQIMEGQMIEERRMGGQIMEEQPRVLAWWGTMYPEFCFGEGNESDEMGNTGLGQENGIGNTQGGERYIKISWWFWEKLEEFGVL